MNVQVLDACFPQVSLGIFIGHFPDHLICFPVYVPCSHSVERYHIQGRFSWIGEELDIRVGINSGEVVAGVIGMKKFIYDLWGDAVNIASRLESHGVAGQIQVSRSTWELVQGSFEFSGPQTIELKGKGEVETWMVVAG